MKLSEPPRESRRVVCLSQAAIASLALSGVLLATVPEGGAAQGTAAKCVQEPNGDSTMDRECWDGGKRRGRWVIRLPGGEVREGSYVAGKKEGHWVIRFADGGVQEGYYVEGVKQGRWVLRYADGTVEEGSVIDGVREGRWVARRPDGSGRTFMMEGGALVAGSVSARNAADLRAAAGSDHNLLLVRQLLNEGVSPNAPDNKGWTAVHFAAAGEAVRNLAVLLAKGGNPTVQDSEGNGPLHLAANLKTAPGRDERKSTAALRILLEGGANPDTANKAGDTPLHLAARTYGRQDASGVEVLLAAGASPYKTNGRGNTPLHAAVETWSNYSEAAVAALLEAGANPRAAGRDSLTPLLMSVRHGPDDGDVVVLLVNAGADPDRKAPDGDTPLHIAIREGGTRGKVDVVDALLAGGADPCIEDSQGFIPYNVATEGGIIHQALDRANGYDRACDRRDEAEARRVAEAERKAREAEARRVAEAERKAREAEAEARRVANHNPPKPPNRYGLFDSDISPRWNWTTLSNVYSCGMREGFIEELWEIAKRETGSSLWMDDVIGYQGFGGVGIEMLKEAVAMNHDSTGPDHLLALHSYAHLMEICVEQTKGIGLEKITEYERIDTAHGDAVRMITFPDRDHDKLCNAIKDCVKENLNSVNGMHGWEIKE